MFPDVAVGFPDQIVAEMVAAAVPAGQQHPQLPQLNFAAEVYLQAGCDLTKSQLKQLPLRMRLVNFEKAVSLLVSFDMMQSEDLRLQNKIAVVAAAASSGECTAAAGYEGPPLQESCWRSLSRECFATGSQLVKDFVMMLVNSCGKMR